MKTTRKENYRVVIYPDVGGCFDPSRYELEICDNILKQVRRHVDDVATTYIVYDTNVYCSYCGKKWTEDDTNYNGGCCDKDAKNAPERGEKYELGRSK